MLDLDYAGSELMYTRNRRQNETGSRAAAAATAQSRGTAEFRDGRNLSRLQLLAAPVSNRKTIQLNDDDLVAELASRFADFKDEIAKLDVQIDEAVGIAGKLKGAGKYGAMARIRLRNLRSRREEKILQVLKPVPGFVKTAKRLNNLPVLGVIFDITLAREMKQSKKSLARFKANLSQESLQANSSLGMLLDDMIGDAERLQEKSEASVAIDVLLKMLGPLMAMGSNALAKYIAGNAAGQLAASGLIKASATGVKRGVKSRAGKTKKENPLTEVEIMKIIEGTIKAQALPLTDEIRADYFLIAFSDTRVNLEDKGLPYTLKLVDMINQRNTPLTRNVYLSIKRKNEDLARSILKEYTKHFGKYRWKFYRSMGESRVA